MRSLFLRIFLSFWTAQALFIILAILLTLALRPREDAILPPGAATQAAAIYEQSGQSALREQFHQTETARHLRVFLFDNSWKEVSGRPAPDWMERILNGKQPKPGGVPAFLLPFHFVRQSAAGPSGRQYVLVAELPPGPIFLLGRSNLHGWGIFIAVLTSGLVCYLLTSYLTGPVVRLRAATQQLAAGDLSARAGASGLKSGRRDEIAGLVRDFDGMAERLETLVNEQNRLLNDISHELRSPLARLNVALGLAWQRTGPDAASVLARIELESTRLEEMIDRLLTLSRLEAGQALLDRSSLRLGELMQEITKDADFEAQSRHCHVRCTIAQECEITGSPSLLRSAIENVVRNATRYTSEGTDVTVDLESATIPAGEIAVIRVCDHGPGVPEAALDKLFRPFFRVDDARGRQTGGSGLGLAITDRAVRLHGGTVRAANQPGGGLCVEIRLPIQPANA
jgi:two-component system, OmpR family, sensor histidine kinase CpxA